MFPASLDRAMVAIVQAFGRLSAQAEEIGAANLGDLEGLALDMSEEIRQICDVSNVGIRTARMYTCSIYVDNFVSRVSGGYIFSAEF